MQTRNFDYRDGGTTLRGILYGETPGKILPGVVVFHDALGLGRHASERAESLAQLGYVSLAADLYGDRIQPRDTAHALELMLQLRNDPIGLRARAMAAFEALRSLSATDPTRIGAIGFCFGGSTALELARSGAPLSALVCFHGGLDTAIPARRGVIGSRILVCTGSADPRVPMSQIPPFLDEMADAGIDCQVLMHAGVQHSFTNPGTNGLPGMAYDARADRRSWAAMRVFFEENLRGEQ